MSSERKILKARSRKKPDYINFLPEEVLCIIFDHLDLRSVKNASVTCQRWHSIIFLSGYINRFVFNIYRSSYYPIRTIKEFMDIVAKSQRCYRKLRWDGEHALEDDLLSVWEAIHPKLTNHLHSLDFAYTHQSKLFPLVIKALPLMSKLRTLTLWDNDKVCDTQEVIPTLQSRCLKHLTIHSHAAHRLDLPHLQTFIGSLNAIHHPDDSRKAAALSRLKQLSVYPTRNNDTAVQRIAMLRSLLLQTRLERIYWRPSLPNEIFSLICERCTTLRELHLRPSLSIVNHLNSLSKLTNLRLLHIYNCSTEIDLSAVNQLEEVQLSRVDKVIKLPTSIRKLQVQVYTFNQLNMSHTILSASNQLTELLVEIEEKDEWFTMNAPQDILKVLPHLKHLKALKFYRGCFRNASFLCMDAPLETLHQLHFEESNVSSKGFLGLQEKFPNLKKPSFSNCGCCETDFESRSSSMSFTESEEDSYDRGSDPIPITESEEDSDDRDSDSTSFTESDEDDQ